MNPLFSVRAAASAFAAACLVFVAPTRAATTSDPFPALRVGLGGAAAFAPGASPDQPQGGFALDVNLGLIVHNERHNERHNGQHNERHADGQPDGQGDSAQSVVDSARAAQGAPRGTSNPLAAPPTQIFFALDVGYSYQGSAIGGHRGLLGMSLGLGQAQQGWAVAYTPRFVAGQAGDVVGVGARNGLSALFFGTTFGLEVAHQFLMVRGQLQHEVVAMVTLNPLTPLFAYALFRRGRLSH